MPVHPRPGIRFERGLSQCGQRARPVVALPARRYRRSLSSRPEWVARIGGVFPALALALLVAGCRGGGNAPEAPAEPDPGPAAATGPEAPAEHEIVLFFPSADDEDLHAEKRRVLPIAAPEDRAKQCLEELFRGPSPPLLAAVPDGVHVRQVYLLPDGTAFADLSADMLKHRGGSIGELQTVYAIVDTLAANVIEIRRIGILIDGKTRETLAGHVDIAQPLRPDYQYVEAASRPAPPMADAATATPVADVPGAAAPAGESGAAGGSGESGSSGDGASGDGTSGARGDARGAGGDKNGAGTP